LDLRAFIQLVAATLAAFVLIGLEDASAIAEDAPSTARVEDAKPAAAKPAAAKPAAEKPAAEKPTDEKPMVGKADGEQVAAEMESTVEQVARNAKPSIVVVTFRGREGQQQGLGTGFVVSEDGLIATNLHVLGEARPLTVQFADGEKHEVVEVHASDRHLDLAVIRIRKPARKLTPLPLGDSSHLRDGMPIAVLGNPLGLQYSVVGGSVVSGTREVEGRKMIQLAVAIEPGNSGGPVLDLRGRVQGIVTLKSLVTKNLGFAIEVDALKSLLERPNAIPMERWLTIGALDSREWNPLFGSRWQQRAGRIHVVGAGQGFGGRSLCLSRVPSPMAPFEVAVSVKLDQESGAAGLVFHADGQDKHYGFYPSSGKLRLTRFAGPDVFSWQVLAERPSEHYRPGDWNRLKVRVEKERIQCFVNDELVVESTDDAFTSGLVGLAKFRDTEAEFKRFRVAASLPDERVEDAAAQRLEERIAALPPSDKLGNDGLRGFADAPDAAMTVLRRRAAEMERRAGELRQVAQDVHVARVVERIRQLIDPKDKPAAGGVDLLRGSLWIAALDDEELDVEDYVRQVDRMAEEIRGRVPADADESTRLAALSKYLFEDNGFHGSRTEYYHRANSYLNRVIDDREGIPITLSILYIELAKRLELQVLGIGLPGHFMVKHLAKDGTEQLVDVFEGGVKLSRAETAAKLRSIANLELNDTHLRPFGAIEILQRCLRNLLSIAQEDKDREAMLRYLEALVTLDPDAVQDRGLRAVVKFETGRRDAAIADLDWFFEERPEGLDLDRIREMQEYFRANRPPASGK
jgi:S1-C subfamily serine protease/regulator of sirC expression with transglutaminase-like and TPR domain